MIVYADMIIYRIEPKGHPAPVGSSRFSPRIVGMDCEMVETVIQSSAVARVTIVAHGFTEQGIPCNDMLPPLLTYNCI